MATLADRRLLTADEFLRIDFGPDFKAELDNGIVRPMRMMAGGSRLHARVQMNLYGWLWNALRGSPCKPFGSDMAVRTSDWSIRYPDLTVDCSSAVDEEQQLELQSPRIIVEVLSPTTSRDDEGVKLDEYCGLPGLDTIVLIDPLAETVRLFRRDGEGRWPISPQFVENDMPLIAIDLIVPRVEIFARE